MAHCIESKVAGWGTLIVVALGVGACSAPPSVEQASSGRTSPAAAPSQTVQAAGAVQRAEQKPSGSGVLPASIATARTSAVAQRAQEGRLAARADDRQSALASKLVVKRFVVSTLVKDREPALSEEALPSDGAPIYAFAELANLHGESENVRVTFERKGGAERVGNVVLPVPANVTRHRTWANTRYIRAAGVWEAVLWSEAGQELSRTAFEVKES
jgi:hypothetical protein